MRKFFRNKSPDYWMNIKKLYIELAQGVLKGYIYSTSNSQVMKSELMRTSIVCLNYSVKIPGDELSKKPPDEKYNYGEK
jgi:divalent metal cation (Fe/Co/Zn/Cd) transporter